ncbi:MAG: hypothetical protein ACI9OJ_000834 [Myxococcota bacterium]|jgi:hypothetical protein
MAIRPTATDYCPGSAAPRWHRRALWFALSVSLAVSGLAGCSIDEKADGDSCTSDSECESGLCVYNYCKNPDLDDDGDGLTNGQERTLGSNPLSADTDADGHHDQDELDANGEHVDADGDGIADLFESLTADVDRDCLPDQLDDSPEPTTETDVLLSLHCSTVGACGLASVTTTFRCDDGVPTCRYEGAEFQIAETRCDEVDNDCDGQTDEGQELDGVTVGGACVALGACGPGVVECGPDGPHCSASAGGSDDASIGEICNGLDDDCDGSTDEGQLTDVGQPVGEPCSGVGVCGAGYVECHDGAVVCSSLPGGSNYPAVSEFCNGLDDDCDGLTDEDFTVEGAFVGAACGSGNCLGGTVVCAPGGVSAVCDSAHNATDFELCNGLDDDCDGAVDEAESLDFGLSGCPTLGVCAEPNALDIVCDGEWHCVAPADSPWQSGTEISCDLLDNDCDGLTDEAFSYQSASDPDGAGLGVGSECGVGVCAGGTVACSADKQGAICTTASNTSLEVCDGEDNDCDGLTDEALTIDGLALGEACDGTGSCGSGLVVCNLNTESSSFGQPVCSTDPGGPDDESSAETCNTLDDDCDGFTDEIADVLANTPTCGGPGVCDGDEGTPTGCIDGQVQCDLSTVSAWEGELEVSCDGFDNNCDGFVDEHLGKVAGAAWVSVSPGTPAPRDRTVATVVAADVILLAGGTVTAEDEPKPIADTWHFNSTTGAWSRPALAPPPPRTGAAMASLDGAFLIGGRDSAGDLLSEVWFLDDCDDGPCEPQWESLQVSGALGARSEHAAVADAESGWIWVIGGDSTGPGAITALDLNGPPKWVAGLPQGPGWRSGVAAVLLPPSTSTGPRLMVHGGRNSDGDSLGDTWVLDIDATGWTPFTPLGSPPPRSGHVLGQLGEQVFLYGGRGADGDDQSDLWVFDTTNQQWNELQGDGPGARSGAALLPQIVDGDWGLVLVGGRSDSESEDSVWQLKPTGIWSPIQTETLPPRRSGGVMSTVAPYNYILYGGQSQGGEPIGSIWELSSGEWLEGAAGPDRVDSAIAFDSSKGRLFVHGGREVGEGDDAEQPLSGDLDVYTAASGLWASVPQSSQLVRGRHLMVFDSVVGRLFLLGGVLPSALGMDAPVDSSSVWSFDPNSGASEVLTVSGAAPTSLIGAVACPVTAQRFVVVLATGQSESASSAYEFATDTMTWKVLSELPPTGPQPVAFVERTSLTLFVGTLPLGQLTVVDLTSGEVTSAGSPAVVMRPGSATTFDATLGRLIGFGGLDVGGYPCDQTSALPFVCSPL